MSQPSMNFHYLIVSEIQSIYLSPTQQDDMSENNISKPVKGSEDQLKFFLLVPHTMDMF